MQVAFIDDCEALVEASRIHTRAGLHFDAMEILCYITGHEQYLADPTSAKAFRASLEQRTGNFSSATENLRLCLDNLPNGLRKDHVWMLLARNAEMKGDADEAALALRQCATEYFANDYGRVLEGASAAGEGATFETYSAITSLGWEDLADACMAAHLYLFATDAYECAMFTIVR